MSRKLPLQIRIQPALERMLRKDARKNCRSLTGQVHHLLLTHYAGKRGIK